MGKARPSEVRVCDETYEVASRLVPKNDKDSEPCALVIQVKHKTICDATYFLTAYNTTPDISIFCDREARFPDFNHPVIVQYEGKNVPLQITRNINGISHLEKLLLTINTCKEFEDIVLKEKSALKQ
jgi:hypothetical protein